MSTAPGPDGHHDDLDAAELEGLALLVPDDPRSLDGDRMSYLRELRDRAGKGTRLERLRGRLARARSGRLGLTGSAIVLLLACVAVIGSSLTLFSPQAGTTTALQVPIATEPPAPVGSVGGLLPDSTVLVDDVAVSLRTARPAVIALVPHDCTTCGPTLRSLLTQAREYGLRLVLAGPPEQKDDLTGLNIVELGASGRVAIDSVGVLTGTYSPAGVTVLLVHEDGIVGAIVRNVTADERLETALVQLDRPGVPAARS